MDIPCTGGDHVCRNGRSLPALARQRSERLPHIHKELPPGHPHVRGATQTGDGLKHAHILVIDKYHRHRPGEAQMNVG
jgi:hypothetical protein